MSEPKEAQKIESNNSEEKNAHEDTSKNSKSEQIETLPKQSTEKNKEDKDKDKDKDKTKRNKTKYIIFGIIALIILSCICMSVLFINSAIRGIGSGNIQTEEKTLDEFNKIELNGLGNIEFVQGSEPSIKIEAEDNILDRIETKVEDETLMISYRRQFPFIFGSLVFPREDVNITITSPRLEQVTLSGSGDFNSDKLITDTLLIDISGSADIIIKDIEAFSIETEISGSGNIEISGTAESQKIDVNGSLDYFAKELSSKDITIDINGSGDLEINVSDSLTVDISGSADIKYLGDPDIEQDISGSGDITKFE